MHRKHIRRWHKLLAASASLIAILAGFLMAPASANSAPAVSMFWADVSRTNQPTLTFYLMTNVTIKNLEASDFYVFGTATGCTVDDNFSQSSFHVVTVRGCSDGTVAVQLGANSVSDLSLNWGPPEGFATDFTTLDRTAPSFTFDQKLTSSTDPSFNLTAMASEQVELVDSLMSPTVSGTGCSLSGVSIAAEKYTFAITGCMFGAESQVTIYANSYKDAIGNMGPAQNVVSHVVKVQAATLPVPTVSPSTSPSPVPSPSSSASPLASPTPTAIPSPSPTAAASAMPTLSPSASASASPVASPTPVESLIPVSSQNGEPPTSENQRITTIVTPPFEPPSPNLPPAGPEAEAVVPMSPSASIRAIESAAGSTPIAPPAPRRAASVAQPQPVQPETLTNPLPAPKTEVIAEPEPPAPARASASVANLGWVMPAASVASIALGAVAGGLLVRSRLNRRPRLRVA
jgi:hypothetical protein